MIVVSNTSPLTNLAAIGQFDLLRRLFGQMFIPEAVWNELNAGGRHHPGRNEVVESEWIQQRQVQSETLGRAFQLELDRGEAEAIALPLELHADLVLLDESEARASAVHMGLRVTGVIGILLAAKNQGAIPSIRPQLDALLYAGFYINNALYQHALQLAMEV